MFSINQADPLILDCLNQFCQGEFYRLIDEAQEEVYDYHDGKLTAVERPCYAVWKRECPCANCISRRAVKEGKVSMKMETVDSQVYLVCALPIVICGRRMALESIWNVTENVMSDEANVGEHGLISDLIDRLNLSVVQDVYTGLYNKSFAENELKNAVLEWKEACPLVVVMTDIDRFKEVNDRNGHVQGDLVIKKLAELIEEWTSAFSGTACRVGGDEFLMILHGVPLEEAKYAAERLKEKIAACEFGQEQPFYVTVSMGAAEYSPDMRGWEQLVDLADRRMYEEKKSKKS